MVTARVLRHILEVPGPWQCFQHLDGGNDVVIDDLALILGQGASPNRQVLQLVFGQEACLVSGHIRPAILRNPLHTLYVEIPHCLATDIAGAKE